jgi:hypothetical protein
MVNTTQTYWEVNGVSLNTYAHNISTLGGGRTNVPLTRGSNILVPYRRGEVYIPKIATSRDITLAMWVAGVDADGKPEGSFEARWQDNFDTLRRLLWRENETVTLTKRFWRRVLTSAPGDPEVYEDQIVTASAEAEFVRGLEPSMSAPGLARTTVTFTLPDPFFYGAEETVEFSSDSDTIDVAGDVPTQNIEVDLGAGVRIVNSSYSPTLSLRSSVEASVDVFNRTVSGQSANALIQYSGSDSWFELNTGENDLVVTGGDATLRYRPAYF